ncbi:hypothetical protein J1605_010890 [Eschrichtius robustus]|uniref:Small vasohibin-binding protein n=1 Tax=Eschrichtius robustus TaxID=9764 RepID=A0AB34GR16_ESCRO|nr:hypothetical protein J1605_010890 [Eschrichtius robustus]
MPHLRGRRRQQTVCLGSGLDPSVVPCSFKPAPSPGLLLFAPRRWLRAPVLQDAFPTPGRSRQCREAWAGVLMARKLQSPAGEGQKVKAEARLAAKRAARAEAREIRMKELERQQKEVTPGCSSVLAGGFLPGSAGLRGAPAPLLSLSV